MISSLKSGYINICEGDQFYFYLISEDQFYEQFTLDEKNKLYDAIGYQENEADPTLPKEVSWPSLRS